MRYAAFLRYLIALCALVCLARSAIAQQTRAALENQNNHTITTNGHGAITGAIVNSMNTQIITSFGALDDTNTWTGVNTFSTPIPAASVNLGYVSTASYGALCNTVTYQAGASLTGTTLSTSGVSVTFTSTDIGKTIDVVGAGAAGAVLETTISAVSGSSATLAVGASTPVTNAAFSYGFDDTSAFQSALNTGQTVYAPALGSLCHISTVTSSTPGQRIYGDGRHKTKFYQMKPTTGLGMIVAAQGLGQTGPTIEDIGEYFYNDETTVHTTPASFPTYPPGVYMQNQPLVTLHRMGIYGGSVCIDASAGDTGYFTIDDLEFSCWVAGINQNGAANPSYWHNLKWWQFTSNPNGCQYNCYAYGPINLQYASGNNVAPAAYWQGSGRTVGLMLGSSFDFISDSLFISGLGIYTEGGATLENISLSNVDLDSFAGIVCNGTAIVTMNGGFLTVGNGAYPFAPVNNIGAVANSGCSISFTGTIFNQFEWNGEQATLYVNGGNATVANSPSINMNGFDTPFAINNDGQLTMTGNYVVRSSTIQPIVAPGPGRTAVVTTTSTSSPTFTVTGNFGFLIANGATVASSLFPGGTTVVGTCANDVETGLILTCTASANASAVGADSNATITNTGYTNSLVYNTSFAAEIQTFITTAATGNGTTATLTYTGKTPVAYAVGSQIIVTGIVPTGYNGIQTVTAATPTTVSFASSATGAQTTAGSISPVTTNPPNTTMSENVFAPIGVFSNVFVAAATAINGQNRVLGNTGVGWTVGCADGTGGPLHTELCTTTPNSTFLGN